MTDKVGRLWLIGLFLGLIGLSAYLWWVGKEMKEPSQTTYLTAEAGRLLGCSPYLISAGMRLDANQNGIPEYLFSCDSSLGAPHKRFIWLEIEKKKVRILLWHTENGFKVGRAYQPAEAYSWLLDRGNGELLALPLRAEESIPSSEPLEILWSPEENMLLLGGPSD